MALTLLTFLKKNNHSETLIFTPMYAVIFSSYKSTVHKNMANEHNHCD